MKPILSFYMGHDANMTGYDPYTDKFYIYEFEKNSSNLKTGSIKHYSVTALRSFFPEGPEGYRDYSKIISKDFKDAILYFKNLFNVEEFEKLIVQKPPINGKKRFIMYYGQKLFPIQQIEEANVMHYVNNGDDYHHKCHALSAYAQSPFKRAGCFTFDGFGDVSSRRFSIFNDYEESNIKLYVPSISHVYSATATGLRELQYTWNYVDFAGKLMGLSAYGKESKESKIIMEVLEQCLNTAFIGNPFPDRNLFSKNMKKKIYASISDAFNLDGWDGKNKKLKCLTDQQERNVAYGAQKWFEEKTLETISSHINEIAECDNNLILTGGSALNVLTNQKIRETWPQLNVYVPPNPHDVCQSHGILINYLLEKGIKPKRQDLTFEGRSIRDNLHDIVKKRNLFCKKININDVVNILKTKKVIGFISGNSEIGPRALGRRSILSTAGKGMKTMVNKVKRREWFRPFAPICIYEDVPKYFESHDYRNLETMSFALKVRPEYKDTLSAITHLDDTARVQGLHKKDNPLLWEILKLYGSPLLNTSFNVAGRGILNTYDEAAWMVINTFLDGFVTEFDGNLYYVENIDNEDSINN